MKSEITTTIQMKITENDIIDENLNHIFRLQSNLIEESNRIDFDGLLLQP